MTPDERNRRLIEIAEQYMRGKITSDEYRAASRALMPDYEAAFRTIANRQVRPTSLQAHKEPQT